MRSEFFLLVTLLIAAGCRTPIPAQPLESASTQQEFLSEVEYRLGTGDEIRLKSLGDATFDGTYQVSESGAVSLPLVGDVSIAGDSLAEAAASIQKAISKYVKEPNVTLTIVSRRSNRAFFSGEFVRVGVVPIDLPMNLISAISLAGGLTPFASGRLVLVRSDSNGVSKRYAVMYRDLQMGAGNFDTVMVRRGDIVIAE
jgi:polysaccharide export outer membrane protein